MNNQINIAFRLILFLAFVQFISCSETGLKDEIVGNWQLKSISTTCSPETLEVTEGTVNANEMGCVSIVHRDSTEAIIITTTQIICSALIFNEDNSVLMLSGEGLPLDTSKFDFKIDEENSIVEICTSDGFCQEYRLDGSELSSEFTLGTMSLSDCTRTFVYQK